MVKTILSIVTMVAIASVLCAGVLGGGAVAQADDFVWDGAGLSGGGPEEDWENATMWTAGSGHPDGTDDNATLADVSSTALVGLDNGKSINDLDITGDSPTRMTLRLGAALNANQMYLRDYSSLNLDTNLTVFNQTELADDVWIDLAADVVVNLLALGQYDAAMIVKTDSTVLNLTTATGSTFTTANLLVDATNGASSLKLRNRTLRVDGGGSLDIVSGATNGYRAKFRLASGALDMAPGGYIVMHGGTNALQRAELDLDESVSLTPFTQNPDVYPGKLVTGGYAGIDLDDDVVVCMKRLTVGYNYGGATAKLVTGTDGVINVNVAACE